MYIITGDKIMLMREYLANLSYKYKGDWDQITKAIGRKEQVGNYDINEKYLTIVDKDYPDELKMLRFPPWVIYYEGNIELLKERKVAIVGSRKIGKYAYHVTKKLCKKLVRDNCLVSGLALGVDGVVHESAIINGGKTIGVIGSGLGYIYPKENKELYQIMRKEHLIISEYPYFVKVEKHHFPWRNRLIAALGKCLYVTQAQIKSGTMHTVNEALNLSKEVYCVPYSLDDFDGEGCNLLIFQGANIIINEDLK